MDAKAVLHYGHQFLVDALHGLPEDKWASGGVCGAWSVKDILIHLTSYEELLVDICASLLDPTAPTPILTRLLADYEGFNDVIVAEQRALVGIPAAWDAYLIHYDRSFNLMQHLSPDHLRTKGVLPWYGLDYDLEDFLVYSFYGHKREHGAQIAVFKDNIL